MTPLLEESESWTVGKSHIDKTFNAQTQTFSRRKTTKDRAMWHGRVSEHPKDEVGGFDPFWKGIAVDHILNEQE